MHQNESLIGQRIACDHPPSSGRLRDEYVAFCLSTQKPINKISNTFNEDRENVTSDLSVWTTNVYSVFPDTNKTRVAHGELKCQVSAIALRAGRPHLCTF